MLLSFMILLCCVSCLLCCYYWVCLVHHHHYDGNCSCMINSQWSELCHHYQLTLFVQGWGRKTENIDLIMLGLWLTHYTVFWIVFIDWLVRGQWGLTPCHHDHKHHRRNIFPVPQLSKQQNKQPADNYTWTSQFSSRPT